MASLFACNLESESQCPNQQCGQRTQSSWNHCPACGETLGLSDGVSSEILKRVSKTEDTLKDLTHEIRKLSGRVSIDGDYEPSGSISARRRSRKSWPVARNPVPKDEVQKIFEKASRKQGFIALRDLPRFIRQCGCDPTESECNSLKICFDSDNVDFEGAYWAVSRIERANVTEKSKKLETALSEFDKSNKGSLTQEELSAMLTSHGDAMSEKEVKAFMASTKLNKKGEIPIPELARAMSKA
eukprot:GFYU01001219.1.p1 GENE.GFYU01001219.1~~GFYU01001219.1.p1  ORF type:complete len:242 (+),score=66.66 GFYU01001219.1:201-926(+)